MASITDILLNAAVQQGLNVVVKTQYGPEVVVYNAAAPAAPPSGFAHLLGPVGVQLRDANGKVLYSTQDWPATNPAAIAAALGGLGGLLFLAVLTIKRGF